MKNLLRILTHIALILVSVFTALLICSIPYNRFEWMLHDPYSKEALTFCALPLDDSAPE